MWLYGQDRFLPEIHVLCERGPNLNPHTNLFTNDGGNPAATSAARQEFGMAGDEQDFAEIGSRPISILIGVVVSLKQICRNLATDAQP